MTDQLTQQQREALEAVCKLEAWAETRVGAGNAEAWGAAARTYILNSTPLPEGVNLGLISEALADFANLISSGSVDGAGQFSPSDLQDQSDLLAAAPTPEDADHD